MFIYLHDIISCYDMYVIIHIIIYIYIRVQICFKIYIISSTYLATYSSDNLFTVAQWVPVG